MQRYKSGFKVNNILLSTLLVDDFESEVRQYMQPATETGTGTGTSKLIVIVVHLPGKKTA